MNPPKIRRIFNCLGLLCLFKKQTALPPIYWRRDQSSRSCFSDGNLQYVAYCYSIQVLILLKQAETEIVFLHKNCMFKWQIHRSQQSQTNCPTIASLLPTLIFFTIYLQGIRDNKGLAQSVLRRVVDFCTTTA